MKNLVIRFVDERGLVTKLITWNTSSLWCHTEALSRDGLSWIGAHAGTGVQARPLDWAAKTTTLERKYAIPIEDAAYAQAMLWLESQVGAAYDYKDIVGLLFHKRLVWNQQRVKMCIRDRPCQPHCN